MKDNEGSFQWHGCEAMLASGGASLQRMAMTVPVLSDRTCTINLHHVLLKPPCMFLAIPFTARRLATG